MVGINCSWRPRLQVLAGGSHIRDGHTRFTTEIAKHEGIGLLAYSPLAFGCLTGKLRHGASIHQHFL